MTNSTFATPTIVRDARERQKCSTVGIKSGVAKSTSPYDRRSKVILLCIFGNIGCIHAAKCPAGSQQYLPEHGCISPEFELTKEFLSFLKEDIVTTRRSVPGAHLGSGAYATVYAVSDDADAKHQYALRIQPICKDSDLQHAYSATKKMMQAQSENVPVARIFSFKKLLESEWSECASSMEKRCPGIVEEEEDLEMDVFLTLMERCSSFSLKEENQSLLWTGLHDICLALEVLHRKGGEHGDLSWGNILRTREDKLVLTDFNTGYDPENRYWLHNITYGKENDKKVQKCRQEHPHWYRDVEMFRDRILRQKCPVQRIRGQPKAELRLFETDVDAISRRMMDKMLARESSHDSVADIFAWLSRIFLYNARNEDCAMEEAIEFADGGISEEHEVLFPKACKGVART